MNYTLIFLGIVIVILLYVLYFYNSNTSTVLLSKADLNAKIPEIKSINSPTNTRYAYGIWVYVNSWNSSSDKIIFSRNNNIKLRLDNTKPSLYCDIIMSDGTTNNRTTITDNFPLQKWVFIIVSVDNQFLDCYLDGKLVKSTKLYKDNNSTTNTTTQNQVLIPLVPPNETTPIILGSSTPFDAQVASFTRWSSPVDPQTVWTAYTGGNTTNGLNLSSLSSYGANLAILQNNTEYSKITLF